MPGIYESIPYEDLVQQLVEKTSELQDAEAALSLLNNGSKKLKIIYDELFEAHQTLQIDSAELTKHKKDLLSKVDETSESFQIERDTLFKSLSEKNVEIDRLERSVEEYSNNNLLMKEEIRRELDELFENKIKHLEVKVASEREKAAKKTREADELMIKLMQTEARAEKDMQLTVEMHAVEVQGLNFRLNCALESLEIEKSAVKTTDELKEKVQFFQAQSKGFDQELEALRTSYSEQISELNDRVGVAESENSHAKFLAAQTTMQLDRALADCTRLEALNRTRESAISELQTQVDKLTLLLSDRKESARIAETGHSDKLEELRRELSSAKAAAKESEETVAHLRRRLAESDERAESARKTGETELRMQLSTLGQSLASEQDRGRAAVLAERQQFAEAERRERRTAEENAKLREEVQGLRNALESEKIERTRISVRFQEKENQNASLLEHTHEYDIIARDYQALQLRYRQAALQLSGTNAASDRSQQLQDARSKLKKIKAQVEELETNLDKNQKEKMAILAVAKENKAKFEAKMEELLSQNKKLAINHSLRA